MKTVKVKRSEVKITTSHESWAQKHQLHATNVIW